MRASSAQMALRVASRGEGGVCVLELPMLYECARCDDTCVCMYLNLNLNSSCVHIPFCVQ